MPNSRLGPCIGQLAEGNLLRLNRALPVLLALARCWRGTSRL